MELNCQPIDTPKQYKQLNLVIPNTTFLYPMKTDLQGVLK